MPLFIGATPVSTGAAPLLHLALAKPWLALNEGLNAMKFASTAWVPILSRTLAAWVGGYAFTYAFTAALARLLPLDNVDALTLAIADGSVTVDGREIYTAEGLRVGVFTSTDNF